MTDQPTPELDDRRANASGLPDDAPKVPQPIPAEHHEEGHEEPKS